MRAIATPSKTPVTARLVRVYGSSHVYGEERTDPLGEALVAPDFPTAGDRGVAWLGAVPEWLPEIRWKRAAIGHALRRAMFGATEGKSVSELIEERLASDPLPTFQEQGWYVTVAVEREVEIGVAQPGGPELIWVEVEDVEPLLEALRDEFAGPINLLAATIEDTLGIPGLFEQVILEDHLCFFHEDRPPLSIPQLEFHAGALSVKKSGTEAALADLRQRVTALGSTWPEARALERAVHWYLAALQSRNRWNRFQWAFLALEILTHKLASRHYSRVVKRVSFDAGDGGGTVRQSLGSLVPPLERLTLAPRFAIVALGLSPSTAEEDLATFASAKKARDDLAHGQITDPAELPDTGALSLVRRYLHLGLRS